LGGVLTFTSPCGFVVIPTFFSYVFKERKRAMFMTALFSLGMILAFIIFGVVAGVVGNFFNLYKEFFSILSGVLLIIFGIMLVFNKGFSVFDFKIKHKPTNGFGIFFLGFFFAIGWTPCVGPILAGIIVLSAGTGTILKSVLLFAFYALGVTLPLLIVSYFSDRYDVSKWFTSRHVEFTVFGRKVYTHLYGIIGGIMLILVGIIMMYFRGTRVFMTEIPKYIPWSMTFFTDMNEYLVKSSFFTSTMANVIGVAIAIILLIVIWKAIRHHNKE
jgi:cytochrome c-type biogenesis protein